MSLQYCSTELHSKPLESYEPHKQLHIVEMGQKSVFASVLNIKQLQSHKHLRTTVFTAV